MVDVHSELKRAREVRCAVVDEIVKSPQDRAKEVLGLLTAGSVVNTGDFSSWDLISFCTLYLASQLAVIPDFKKEVESLAYKLYEAHYFHGGDFDLYDENFILARFKERAAIVKAAGGDNTGDFSESQ